jgi:NAD(P)-dependent dehydrogenase (short-subunit alcohol dehydrogenase family)
MLLDAKVAVITGGASGLGAATARMIVEAGGKAAIIDRNLEAATQTAASIGTGAIAAAADVSDAAAMESAVAAISQQLGAIHILINCAGIGTPMRVITKDGSPTPLDAFAKVVTVNLIGTFNAIRLCAAVMNRNAPDAQGERGVIINTASIAAFDGQVGQAAYSASKGGIAGMTLPLARDLARHGIRVMTIAPGIFDTPMLAGLNEEFRRSLGASVPFPPRLGHPDEYAQLARAIIENPMLNGEVIRLDGALRMAPR